MKLLRVVILNDMIRQHRLPLFQWLSQQGLDLKVLYCSKDVRKRGWKIPEQLPFPHEILAGFALRLRRPPYDEPRIIIFNPGLFIRLLRLNPDVVVGYAYSVPAMTAFVYAKLFRKGFISWSSDTLHSERYLGRLQRFLRRAIIPRADACVATNEGAADKFLSYGAEPESVRVSLQVHPIAEHSRIERSSEAETLREALGIAEADLMLLYVGQLTELKGVRGLVEEFDQIRRKVPSARLVMVGDGPLRAELRELARSLGLDQHVRLAGFIQPEELITYYASASIFVFPTLEDDFAVVIPEAASAGLPMVCSEFAGATSAYVEHGANGYVINPKRPGDIAGAVLKIAADENLKRKMSLRSAEISSKNSLNRSVQEYMRAINLAAVRARNAP
jgi:glycosyltransferase involved in cell wall biosynthesis